VSVLTQPRPRIVDEALRLARDWCTGRVIDGAPALGHAVRVALTLDRHWPTAPARLTAAVLVHDAPEFAPRNIDLDAVLTRCLGPAVTRVVRALEAEHRALDNIPGGPPIPIGDPWVLHASTADKIVALGSMLRRATVAPDPATFWAQRRALHDLLPYFRAFHTAAAPHLPAPMAGHLHAVVTRVEHLHAVVSASGQVPR
jgi:hypothetical protein